MLVTSFLELFSLISIVPLLISISNPSDLTKYKILSNFIKVIPIINENNFFNYAYLLIVIIALFSTILRIYNLWISEILSAEIGSELSCKAYDKILNQNYSFHINNKSSSLIASLTDHVNGLILVLRSFLRLFISIILVITLLLGLLLISRNLTLIIFGFFY